MLPMNISFSNSWPSLIHYQDVGVHQKKSRLVKAIEKIATRLGCCTDFNNKRKFIKAADAADFLDLPGDDRFDKIAKRIYIPEGFGDCKSDWTVVDGRLFVRECALKTPDFWKNLEFKSKDISEVVFTFGEGEISIPAGMVQRLIRGQPDSLCLKRKAYCQFLDLQNRREIVELPEFQVRVIFPLFARHCLGRDFKRHGTQEDPLNLNISKENYLLIKEYLETGSSKDVFDRSGSEVAELFELLAYIGHFELFEQLEALLELSLRQDRKTYLEERLIWYANLYANISIPRIRHQLEEYFSTMLSKLVVTWKKQSTPQRAKFVSIQAQKNGEIQQPNKRKLDCDYLPKPDSLESIIDVFKEIKLSYLVINFDGPKWFWESLKTIESLSKICFRQNSHLLNPNCQKALKEMAQKPKLVLEVPEEYAKYQKSLPEGFDLETFYENSGLGLPESGNIK